MCKIYAYHYKRIMEGIDKMKKNEYPKPKEKKFSMMEIRKRFNVLKYFYSGDKVMIHPKWKSYNKEYGIEPFKEYTIKSIYCSNHDVSLSLFDSDNTIENNLNSDDSIKYKITETLFDPRMFCLIDPVARIPTEITFENDENNKIVRVSKLSGTIIPKPKSKYIGRKFYNAFMNKNGPYDTIPSVALNCTYKSTMKFPHEEIMECLNIKPSYDWGLLDIRSIIEIEKN